MTNKIIDVRTGWHLKSINGHIMWLSPDFKIIHCKPCVEKMVVHHSVLTDGAEASEFHEIIKIVEANNKELYNPNSPVWLKITVSSPQKITGDTDAWPNSISMVFYSDSSLFYFGGEIGGDNIKSMIINRVVVVSLHIRLKEEVGRSWHP